MASTIVLMAATGLDAGGQDPVAAELVVGALVVFLVARDLASRAGPEWRPLARNLLVAVVPLLAVFLIIAITRLASDL